MRASYAPLAEPEALKDGRRYDIDGRLQLPQSRRHLRAVPRIPEVICSPAKLLEMRQYDAARLKINAPLAERF